MIRTNYTDWFGNNLLQTPAPPRLQRGVYGFEFVTCNPFLLKYIIPLVPALSSDDMIYLLIVTND